MAAPTPEQQGERGRAEQPRQRSHCSEPGRAQAPGQDAGVLGFSGALVLWCSDALVLGCSDALVLGCSDALPPLAALPAQQDAGRGPGATLGHGGGSTTDRARGWTEAEPGHSPSQRTAPARTAPPAPGLRGRGRRCAGRGRSGAGAALDQQQQQQDQQQQLDQQQQQDQQQQDQQQVPRTGSGSAGRGRGAFVARAAGRSARQGGCWG